jgi:predicted permease
VTEAGGPPPDGRSAHLVDFTMVDPGFFAAAGIPILEGRNFDQQEREDGAPVAIINQALARRFWPGESPLGRTLHVETPGFSQPTVVGVARTTKVRSLGEAPQPFIYLPYAQEYTPWVSVVARTRGDANATARDLYRLLRQMAPDTIVYESKTMAEHIEVMLILRRLSAILSCLFAVSAVALASIGLHGVVSYAVARRTKETGIRMSLGARPLQVVELVVRGSMKPVAFGGLVGLVIAALVSQLLGGLLYGVSPLDPLTFCAAPALLLGVALLAATIPALRGSRVDPVDALRAV